MTAEDIRSVLEELAAGNTTVDAALLALRKEPFSDLGYAKIDHHREMRQGAAEVIYGASKTYEQIKGISQSLLDNGQTCQSLQRAAHLRNRPISRRHNGTGHSDKTQTGLPHE